MSEEDLALTLGGGRVGVGVRLAHFEVSLHVDERALLERAQVVVGMGHEGKDMVPRRARLGVRGSRVGGGNNVAVDQEDRLETGRGSRVRNHDTHETYSLLVLV